MKHKDSFTELLRVLGSGSLYAYLSYHFFEGYQKNHSPLYATVAGCMAFFFVWAVSYQINKTTQHYKRERHSAIH